MVKKQNASIRKRDRREHRDAALETKGFVFATDKVHQRHHQHGGEHAARRRQHKAPGLQGDALRWVVGDNPAQRAVRDVNNGVEQGQQRVGDRGVNQLAVMTQVRRAVGQYADEAERNRAEQDPRAEFPPATAGTVGQQPHAGVGYRIQRAGQQEHGADIAGRNTKNIGIEKHHIQHDVIKNDVACGIAHAVANLLFDGQNMIFHRTLFSQRCRGLVPVTCFVNHPHSKMNCDISYSNYVSCFM